MIFRQRLEAPREGADSARPKIEKLKKMLREGA